MTGKTPSTDKFIAMVSAKAETELRLCDFEPHAMIATPVHEVKRARFPAIDYHNHLDAHSGPHPPSRYSRRHCPRDQSGKW